MRLKSIKLAGFKSFVDPTTVPFPTNMSAIVGPNGCGKSNIIDAVKWVMGESSAKHLRGESMTDVIFNGSSARQPTGQASIELLFDNTQGKLSGEYGAFAEISIRRKVTREGVSQYYINGSKCRRRDVTDIFLGTGLGPRSYAIIEQGMISRIIESKPEELRVYLEEAAGISKYKERRKETESRMRRTEENLERLRDIRLELDKTLQRLDRQAKAAERYKTLRAEERLAKAQLASVRWKSLLQQAEIHNQAITQLGIESEKVEKARSANQSDIEKTRVSSEDLQAEFNAVQGYYYEVGAQVAKAEQAIRFQKDQAQKVQAEIAELKGLIHSSEQQLEMTLKQRALADEAFKAKNPVLESLTERLGQEQNRLVAAEHEFGQWQEAWDQFSTKASSSQRTAEVQQSKMQSSETAIRQLSKRYEALLEEQKNLMQQQGELEVEDHSAALDRANQEIERAKTAQDKLTADVSHLTTNIRSERDQIAILEKQLATLIGQIASLNTTLGARVSLDGFDVDAWQNSQNMSGAKRVLDQLEVKNGWEQAVESVLSGWLESYVIGGAGVEPGDLAGLQGHLTLLEENAEPVNSVAGSLAEQISGHSVLSSIASTVYCCEAHDIESRRQALRPQESLVTRDGHWFGKHWSKFYAQPDLEQGLIRLKEKLANAKAEQLSLEKGIAARLDEFKKQEAQLDAAQQEQNKIAQNLVRLNDERTLLISSQKSQETKNEQLRLRLARAESEIQSLKLQVENENQEHANAQSFWQQALAELEQHNSEREKWLEQKQKAQSLIDESRRNVQSIQSEKHATELDMRSKSAELQSLTQASERYRDALTSAQQRLDSLLDQEELPEQSLPALEKKLETYLEKQVEADDKLQKVRQSLEEATEQARALEQSRQKLGLEAEQLKTKVSEEKMALQATQMNQASQVERAQEEGFTPEQIWQDHAPEQDEGGLSELIQQLDQKIRRLGPINLAAIDEYASESERKSYLDGQNKDLEEALETLVSAIKKIDKETKARFKETFDRVNESLQVLFPKIFGGGRACLELTGESLLDTGVEIIAQPPGKRNVSIHLLSGGEKALTAISLIFAIFQLNPAPFCMLDEVDAPLDDANVGRFARLVKEMSETVQFIYISHNKATMEAADQLMGVTMGEPGVSRLVSVNVSEAAELAEA